jgi:hypothetical protein
MVRQVEGPRALAGEPLEVGSVRRQRLVAVVEDAARAGAFERLDFGPMVIGRREDLVAGTDAERPQPVQQAVPGPREQPAAVFREREREAAATTHEPDPRVERRERQQHGVAHRTRASARLASGRP